MALANDPPPTGDPRMAQATRRLDLLSPAGDTGRPRPPDFTALLKMADIGAVSSEAAHTVRESLACFRSVAQAHGFSALLTELAILNDELLHLALEPGEHGVEIASVDPSEELDDRLQFVSVLASYLQFGTNDCLLRAWRQATAQVVDVDQRAIVGEMDAYQQAFIWDRISAHDVACAPANEQGWDGEIALGTVEDDQDLSRFVTVGLPMAYSLGADTIQRIQKRDSRTDEARKIVHHLIARFLSAAKAELDETSIAALSNSVLFIVPFARPWLFGDEVEDRPGGGVFMLCSVEPHPFDLQARLRSVTQDINWFLFRAAVLEAQQQRYSTRETDLTQFSHMVSRHLRTATSQAFVAFTVAEQQPVKDVELLKALATVERTTQRREVPYRMTDPARPAPDFVKLFGSTVDKVLAEATQYGLREEWRRERSRNVTNHTELQLDMAVQVRTDVHYLDLLLYELYRNALEHGAFSDQHKRIDTVLFTQDDKILVRVSNPLDAASCVSLTELLRRRRLVLGLTQIELLARTYALDLPKFNVADDAVAVTCVVGLLHRRSTV